MLIGNRYNVGGYILKKKNIGNFRETILQLVFGSMILRWNKLLNSHNVQLPVSNQSPKKIILKGKKKEK